ncbi:MAG TPA: sigma-54 dependent transcriptional regulator [Nitrospirota bacterium]|nr:sigma-54 dependent transcriptional regulator [Nitrospirota bacterium]
MWKILVIEDDETVRDVLRFFLTSRKFDVSLAENGETGLDMARVEKFDLILTDLVMPGITGMDVLKEITAATTSVPVIVMTAFSTVQTAVEAMRNGAFDYVTKPFNLDELIIVLEKALSVSKLQKENVMLKMQLKKKYNFKGLVGDSPSMQTVYELIEKIADTDSTILITGESGTGKELIAKTIHYNNISRAGGPFVPINCAAIPRDLLESELFGHEKGAFTGAINTRLGRFELAQGGTLFLDEVGELDPSLQVKLLRVLQEREFERVGGMKTIKVDVRILAATNKDLEKATKEGKFREDLYYRLNVIPLHLPPLRSRQEDIPLLAAFFGQEFCRKKKREPFSLDPQVMDCLLKYRWPGNVRELENLMERLTILVSGPVVQLSDLPEKLHLTTREDSEAAATPMATSFRAPDAAVPQHMQGSDFELGETGIDLNELVAAMERNMILKALKKSDGVRSKAAQFLGLNRTTLLEKMKKMKIEIQKQ